MTPNQFKKVIKAHENKRNRQMREQDYLNHILGVYIGRAFSGDYPDKPFLDKQENSGQIMTDEEMERMARRNTIMMGGEIDGKGN